jgi:hypothetical protein
MYIAQRKTDRKVKEGIQMKFKGLITLLIGLAMLVSGSASAWALASENILLTVTIQVLSVDVEDAAVAATWGLGVVVGGTTCNSWVAAPVAYTAAPASWQDGVDVENDGNGDETMGLQVAATGVWVSDTAGNNNNAADADDEYIYRALFDTAGTVAAATFGSEDRVDSAAVTKADAATIYTDGNADAASMAATDVELLFVQFVVPATTVEAIPSQHTVTLTISAETTY